MLRKCVLISYRAVCPKGLPPGLLYTACPYHQLRLRCCFCCLGTQSAGYVWTSDSGQPGSAAAKQPNQNVTALGPSASTSAEVSLHKVSRARRFATSLHLLVTTQFECWLTARCSHALCLAKCGDVTAVRSSPRFDPVLTAPSPSSDGGSQRRLLQLRHRALASTSSSQNAFTSWGCFDVLVPAAGAWTGLQLTLGQPRKDQPWDFSVSSQEGAARARSALGRHQACQQEGPRIKLPRGQ